MTKRPVLYKVLLCLLLLLLVIVGIRLCYHMFHKESYPYFYYEGYYYVSHAPVGSEELEGPLCTVTRNTEQSKDNRNGDSNQLPEGTKIYSLKLTPAQAGLESLAAENPSGDGYLRLDPMIDSDGGTVRQVTVDE